MNYTRLGSAGLKISRVALGTTFWDTANVYSAGSSEEIVGRANREYSRRAGWRASRGDAGLRVAGGSIRTTNRAA